MQFPSVTSNEDEKLAAYKDVLISCIFPTGFWSECDLSRWNKWHFLFIFNPPPFFFWLICYKQWRLKTGCQQGLFLLLLISCIFLTEFWSECDLSRWNKWHENVHFLWLKILCKNWEPYDNPFREKSNPAEGRREEKKTLYWTLSFVRAHATTWTNIWTHSLVEKPDVAYNNQTPRSYSVWDWLWIWKG